MVQRYRLVYIQDGAPCTILRLAGSATSAMRKPQMTRRVTIVKHEDQRYARFLLFPTHPTNTPLDITAVVVKVNELWKSDEGEQGNLSNQGNQGNQGNDEMWGELTMQNLQ